MLPYIGVILMLCLITVQAMRTRLQSGTAERVLQPKQAPQSRLPRPPTSVHKTPVRPSFGLVSPKYCRFTSALDYPNVFRAMKAFSCLIDIC
jgi:hypothetical protein